MIAHRIKMAIYRQDKYKTAEEAKEKLELYPVDVIILSPLPIEEIVEVINKDSPLMLACCDRKGRWGDLLS